MNTKDAIEFVSDHIGTKPTFILDPELLMNDNEKKQYKARQIESLKNNIEELNNLFNEYYDMYKKYETHLDKDVLEMTTKDLLSQKVAYDDTQKSILSKNIKNALILQKLKDVGSITSMEEEELRFKAYYLLQLEEEYYGCNASL